VIPSIAAQTDPDFKICIAASPRMPSKYLHRLEDSVRGLQQVSLVVQDAPDGGTVHDVFEEWHRHVLRDKPGQTLHFRIDDDDAFTKDFVRLMRDYANRLRVGEALTFPNGLIAGRYNAEATIAPMHKPFHSIGLGFVKDRFDLKCSPFRGVSHSRTGFHRPSFTVPHSPAWIYVLHGAADTQFSQAGRFEKALSTDFAVRAEEQLQRLQDSFPFLTPQKLLEVISGMP
jgi:hypothetical protein